MSIVLPDDTLDALGYARGDLVEVLLAEVWQGDLAAVLTTGGRWHVGFLFLFEAGIRLSTSRSDVPPSYFSVDQIVRSGRVVRHNGRAVLQAGITLPEEGVDRVRFRMII